MDLYIYLFINFHLANSWEGINELRFFFATNNKDFMKNVGVPLL